MRQDLLVLDDDDLATISNRGTVKRCQKELSRGKVDVEIEALDEQGSSLRFVWSDEITCTLPADATVHEAECTCPATGMCRHIIRSVMAYRDWAHEQAGGDEQAGGEVLEAEALAPWDPGEIEDEAIDDAFTSAKRRKAQKALRDGLVLELIRSTKPIARFHKLGHTLRFQVPGDLRYTRCDCAAESPCVHVPMAIWGFRQLEAGALSGFVTTGEYEEPRADALLEASEQRLCELLEYGLTGTPKAAMTRIEQLEHQLEEAAFVWPATILHDLRRQYDHYASHDARFSPTHVADLIGEFLIRGDALRQKTTPVPRLFVRGTEENARTRLGQARLVGLGCTVIHRKRSVILQALLQDNATGMIMALGHEFLDPEDEGAPPPSFAELSGRLVIKGRDIASLGRGQLVLKKATLHADHHIELGRAPASAYPQSFRWEELPAPLHAEHFDEVRARLQTLPPASLRPRRVGEDFHVVPITRVEEATFSVRDQAVTATLIDPLGRRAMIFHPYTNRNRLGTERLLARLSSAPESIHFVAGSMRVGAHGLIVRPTGVVFDAPDRPDTREMIQPWVDEFPEREASDTQLGNARPPLDPIDTFRAELANALGELYLLGLNHVDAGIARQWRRLYHFGLRLGVHDILGPVADVCALLDPATRPTGEWREAATQAAPIFEATVLSRLVQEQA